MEYCTYSKFAIKFWNEFKLSLKNNWTRYSGLV